MIELHFDNFYVICLHTNPEFRSAFFWGNAEDTKEFILNVEEHKASYKNYWKTNERKEYISIYDEIISKIDEVWIKIFKSGMRFYVIRSHSYELNPLEELDFLIWCNRIKKSIVHCQRKPFYDMDGRIMEIERNLILTTDQKLRRNYLNFETAMQNLTRKTITAYE